MYYLYDLPSLEHKEMPSEELSKKKLVEINNEFKIYSSIIDINRRENVAFKKDWQSELDADSLDLKVQMSIAFKAIILWKKQRDVIRINLDTKFTEQGIQSDFNEIEPLKLKEIENGNDSSLYTNI